jgi:hypothetical protein
MTKRSVQYIYCTDRLVFLYKILVVLHHEFAITN